VTQVAVRNGRNGEGSMLYYGTGGRSPEIGIMRPNKEEECGWETAATKRLKRRTFGSVTTLSVEMEDPYRICAVGTSKGFLRLYKHARSTRTGESELQSILLGGPGGAKRVRMHKGAMTDIAYLGSKRVIASVGEDGAIAINSLVDLCEGTSGTSAMRTRFFRDAESAALYAALFPREETRALLWTAGANPCAQIQMWDLREGRGDAAIQIQDRWKKDVDSAAAHLCIAQHRTMPEVLVTGSSTGNICFWDIRKGRGGPTEGLISTHRFHPHGAVLSLETVSVSHDRTCLLSCGSGGKLALADIDQCISGAGGSGALDGTILLRDPLGFSSVCTHNRSFSDRDIILGADSEQIMFAKFPRAPLVSHRRGLLTM